MLVLLSLSMNTVRDSLGFFSRRRNSFAYSLQWMRFGVFHHHLNSKDSKTWCEEFYVSFLSLSLSLSLFLISTLLACLLAFFLLFLLFFLALLLLFLVGWVKPRPDSIQLCNTVDTIFRSYSYNFANRCFPFPNVHFVYLRSCRHCLSIRLL